MQKKGFAAYRAPGLSVRSKVPSLHTNLKPPPAAKKLLVDKPKPKKKGDESYSDEEKVRRFPFSLLLFDAKLTQARLSPRSRGGRKSTGRRRPTSSSRAGRSASRRLSAVSTSVTTNEWGGEEEGGVAFSQISHVHTSQSPHLHAFP